ncbi:MAG: hypothetical protein ACYCZK_06035, partial [Microbacteriaceae bacterium]
EAVAADSIELRGGESVLTALTELAHPTVFVSAPRGLVDEVPPLYPQDVIDAWRQRLPGLVTLAVEDVNHYTIIMSARGAARIARIVVEAVEAARSSEVSHEHR